MISSIQVILAQEHQELLSIIHFHLVGLILWLSRHLPFLQVLEVTITKHNKQEVFSKVQVLIISSRILSSSIISQQSFLKVPLSLRQHPLILEIKFNSNNSTILICLISPPRLTGIIKSKGPQPKQLLWSPLQQRHMTKHSFNLGIKYRISS